MLSPSMEIEVIEDSFKGAEAIPHIDFNKVLEDEEVESKELKDPSVEALASVLEKNEVANFDLNKFPTEESENEVHKDKGMKEVVKSLLKIFLHKFY